MSNLSFVKHVGDGVTNTFLLAVGGDNIGYLDTRDIYVYVDGVEVTFSIQPASPHLAILDEAPADGSDVLIRRQVSKTDTYSDFSRGNVFSQKNMNNSFLQTLYLSQEWLDGFLPEGSYQKQDMDFGSKFAPTNLRAPVVPSDAVTKEYADIISDRVTEIENTVISGDTRFLSYTYKNGSADGGEILLSVPYAFQSINRVYINGSNQTYGLAWDFDVDTQLIELAEELETGDEVVIEIGFEPEKVLDNEIVSGASEIVATGTTTPRSLADRAASFVNVKDFGAVNYIHGSGLYPDSGKAIQDALNSGASEVYADGVFISTLPLVVPKGVSLIGTGIDYWDTYRPNEDNLLKSMGKGTHILFKGTGLKNKTFVNLGHITPPKNIGGVDYGLTEFNLGDSVSGAPATLRQMSVAVELNDYSQIKNLRVVPFFDGIDGYNDFITTSLSDDWDVGIWAKGAYEATIDNVQSVGYWRAAGTLVTENDGSFVGGDNAERLRVSKLDSQGIRGLLVRNSPQIPVASNTDTTITFEDFPNQTLTAGNQFIVFGSGSVFTFTGYSYSAGEVTLTGVSPNLPANVSNIRSVSAGSNISGTVFNDCTFTSFEHSSGTPSEGLDLPVSGAFEIDGYPLRGLDFIHCKFQTTYDKLNSIYGDCRDVKVAISQLENGVLIAYSNSEVIGYTENLRFTNTYISGTVDREGFTPREFYSDYDQSPTQFTDGATILKPSLPDKALELKSFDDINLARWNPVDESITLKDYGDRNFVQRLSSGDVNITARNYSLKNLSGTNIVTLFSSGNGSIVGGWTVGGELVSSGASRPQSNEGSTLGTSAFYWSSLFSRNITLKSPNGTEYVLSVDDSGNIIVT